MLSLLTNTSGLQALCSLSQTQANLQNFETQAATGLKVATASDSAAYWSIATKMNTHVSAFGAVSDALNESAAMVSVMSTALNQVIPVLGQMRNDLISASQPDADLDSIDTDIAARQQELISIGKSATFNGQNWLVFNEASTDLPDGYPVGVTYFGYGPGGSTMYAPEAPPNPHPSHNVDLVSGFDPATGVSSISVDTSNIQLFSTGFAPHAYEEITFDQGILGQESIEIHDLPEMRGNYTGGGGPYHVSVLQFSLNQATSDDIANMLAGVEQAINSVTAGASQLGGVQTQISEQQKFVTTLTDALRTGAGVLVDADMNEVSTRLSALQVQQQLGVQALSIANTDAEAILRLFQ